MGEIGVRSWMFKKNVKIQATGLIVKITAKGPKRSRKTLKRPSHDKPTYSEPTKIEPIPSSSWNLVFLLVFSNLI